MASLATKVERATTQVERYARTQFRGWWPGGVAGVHEKQLVMTAALKAKLAENAAKLARLQPGAKASSLAAQQESTDTLKLSETFHSP